MSAFYVLSYACLLRVRSEALPIILGDADDLVCDLGDKKAVLVFAEGKLHLRLARRKNRSSESTLVRDCRCHRSRSMCAFHVVGAFVQDLPRGSPVFSGLTGADAISKLRTHLAALGVSDARSYKLHDFRRGHAQDLAERGSALSVILRAGDWRSSAFMSYLDTSDLQVRLRCL